MGLINWIFDFYQQSRIERLHDEVVMSRGPERTVDVDRLERAIGELALAVKTVQQLAVEKGLCTAEEFHRRLRQIDAEDGRVDGRSPIV